MIIPSAEPSVDHEATGTRTRSPGARCVVVIPTYKVVLSPEESRAFSNAVRVLSRWPTVLLIQSGLSPAYYENLRVREALKFQILAAPALWVGTFQTYNDMALSPEFYKMFDEYDYMLLCQLDVWVFRDDLEDWISRGFDYVGAPWFLLRQAQYRSLEALMFPQGGNGGFSLRRVQKMIELTSHRRRALNLALLLRIVARYLEHRRYDLLGKFLRGCQSVLQDADAFQKKFNVYEDVMLSVFYSFFDRTFKVAPAREEFSFATEVYSEELLKTRLKWQLPSAIHGYDKYLPPRSSIDAFRNDRNRIAYTEAMRKGGGSEAPGEAASPLVTIVTATSNLVKAGRTESFKKCMQSVHSQTYSNIEHIIIDNASTDGTLELIRSYEERGWCLCFSEHDKGVWDAMYKGQQRANGVFVNFLNSDDYFTDPSAVQVAVSSLLKKGAAWFFSEGTILYQDGRSERFPTSLWGVFNCMGILHQTVFIRTDLLRAVNPFATDHVTRENYLMLVLCLNKIMPAYSRTPLVCYREGGWSLREYGGPNFPHTVEDFGRYLYENAGDFWGMTLEECRSMLTWSCFASPGVAYSYRLSTKLRIPALRIAFTLKLLGHIRRSFPSLVARKIRYLYATRLRHS